MTAQCVSTRGGAVGRCVSLDANQTFVMMTKMETFSVLLALCAGNTPVINEFPSQRPVTRSFDVFVDLRLNKRLNIYSWRRWFETPSGSLWRHSNVPQLLGGASFHEFQCYRLIHLLSWFIIMCIIFHFIVLVRDVVLYSHGERPPKQNVRRARGFAKW